MKAKLISKEYGEFVFDELATIGRAKGSTVTLEATVVSNEHARISFDSGRSAYVLEDLDSLNGTQLDGVRIERKEVLGKLHVVCFGGSVDFIFQLLDGEEGSELDTIDIPPLGETKIPDEVPELPTALREPSGKSAEIDGEASDEVSAEVPAEADGEASDEVSAEVDADSGSKAAAGAADPRRTKAEEDHVPVPEVLAQASAAVAPESSSKEVLFLEFSIDDRSLRFPLEEGENVVGRSKTADIRIDLADLSRRHATLTVAVGEVLVRDEGSRNHTFVDGKQIETEVAVSVGARIVFGRVQARLVVGAETEQAEAGQGEAQKDKS